MPRKMKVLQQEKGSDKRGKDGGRQEKVKVGRARMKEDRRENSREKEKVMCYIQEEEGMEGDGDEEGGGQKQ